MKARIFLSTFGLPTLWLVIFSIKKYYPGFMFNEYVAIGLCIGSLLRIIIIKRFVFNLTMKNDRLIIEYYTQLLRKKTLTLISSNIKSLTYLKRNRLWDEFDELEVKHSGETLRFQLATKEIREKISLDLTLLKSTTA